MNFFFFTLFKNYRNWRYSIITNVMNVTCPNDLFKNELLFIQELQELEIFNYRQRHERHLP